MSPSGRAASAGGSSTSASRRPAGVDLRPLARWSGRGPGPDLIELARWAAWRWAGRPASFLRTASPERNVAALPPAAPAVAGPPPRPGDAVDRLAEDALGRGRAVLRLPPAADPAAVALAAARRGHALVLCPTAPLAAGVARTLRRAGVRVAGHPRDWAQGAAGATVVGTRAAAWAPVGSLARDRGRRRARRGPPAGAGPDLARAGRGARARPSSRRPVRHDRRRAPRSRPRAPARCSRRRGRLSGRAGRSSTWSTCGARTRAPASCRRRWSACCGATAGCVCVLNRTGRARLLACRACGELAPLRAVRRGRGPAERRRPRVRPVRGGPAGRVPRRAVPPA